MENPYLLFEQYTVDDAARVVWDGEQSYHLGVIESAIQSAIDAGKLKTLSVAFSDSEIREMVECDPFFAYDAKTVIARDDLFNWFEDKGLKPYGPNNDSQTQEELKPLDPRKETTLNCLIAVLAKKLNYSHDDTDTVGKIHALLERQGVHMDKKTIRGNIKAAFSSLNEKRE